MPYTTGTRHGLTARWQKMKATKAIVAQRVEDVLKIRLHGGDFADVVQYAAGDEKEGRAAWGVSQRQLWNYIAKSDELLEQREEPNRTRLYRRHLAQRRLLFARAVEANDLRTALAIVQDEARLQGLYDDALNGRITELERQIAALEGRSAKQPLTREYLQSLSDEELDKLRHQTLSELPEGWKNGHA